MELPCRPSNAKQQSDYLPFVLWHSGFDPTQKWEPDKEQH